MKVRALVVVNAIAALVGLTAGILNPSGGTAATYTEYSIWNYPGVVGSTAVLNCGWHEVCTSGTDGDNLDWSNAATLAVQWRSHSTNSTGQPTAGNVERVVTSSGSCKSFNARLRSVLNTDLGYIRYAHSEPGAWTLFAVQSGGGYGVSMTIGMGTTATEPSSCQTSGPHLHQGRQPGSAWSKNSPEPPGYPTREQCSTNGCRTYYTWSYWQHYRFYAVWH